MQKCSKIAGSLLLRGLERPERALRLEKGEDLGRRRPRSEVGARHAPVAWDLPGAGPSAPGRAREVPGRPTATRRPPPQASKISGATRARGLQLPGRGPRRILLRSATIGGSFCCVLHDFGVVLLLSALIWRRFAAVCNGLVLIYFLENELIL